MLFALVDDTPEVLEQIPKTSKSDKQNHGLGIQSVIDTVNQNNGAIEFYEQDNWLIVDVIMAI